MLDFFGRLFDPSGFVPHGNGGDWTPELVWLHVGSDLFIGLAFVSIPLVLMYLVRKRSNVPFPHLFALFAAFILACGVTHLVAALVFHHPLYRLGGLMKLVTAAVSWATVFALISAAPRVMDSLVGAPGAADDTALHRPVSGRRDARKLDYIVAILAAVMAILLRGLLDEMLMSDHVFVVSLLAVVAVSWQYGFGPGLVTLFVSMFGFIFFFVSQPRHSFTVHKFGDQLATVLFFLCGVACCTLGEAQRYSRRKAKQALAGALEKQSELEVEVNRRRVVEYNLRQREEELLEANRNLATAADARRDSEEYLRSVLDNSPDCVKVLTVDGRVMEMNRPGQCLMEIDDPEQFEGRVWAEMWPDREEVVRRAVATAAGGKVARFQGPANTAKGTPKYWDVQVAPVPGPDGNPARLVCVSRDITEQRRVEESVRHSEATLRAFYDNSPLNMGIVELTFDGDIKHVYDNPASCRFFGVGPGETAGKLASALGTPPDTIALWRKHYRQSAATREAAQFDHTFDAPGGTRWLAVTVSAVPTPPGTPTRYCYVAEDVTERQRAVREMRLSEARFRTLVAAVPQIVWVARPDGSREYSNAKWYEFTGMTEAESAGWGWADALHPDDRAESEAKWRHTIETGEEFEIARRYRGADGEYRWFLGRALPQRDESGEVVRWFGTSTDIHDARQASEALRRSEERFRTLTEAVPNIVWNAEADGTATYFNTRWVEYTGITVDDIEYAGRNGWLVCVHPDDHDRVAAAWRDTVTKVVAGENDRFAHEVRLRRGGTDDYRWFLSVAIPLRGPDGTVDQWIGSMADIHDQKTAAERVQVAADRFRTLTEAVPQMVWTADPRGTVTSFNRRWGEYTGLPPADSAAPGWEQVVHPDDFTRVNTSWQLAAAQGADHYTQQFRLRAADGEYRWMLSNAIPLRTPAGEIVEWVGSLTDIDDQKQAAQNLERTVRDRTAQLELTNLQLTEEVVERTKAEELVTATARELKRSNEELEQFAYIASHDLQEPLRKIQSFGDLLKTKYREQLPEGGKEYTDKMLNSAGRMRRLIDDLLSLSRITSQGKPYTRVELTDLVNQVKSDLDLRIDQAGGTVEVGSLPAIDADPSQIRQLFQNLFVNALKFHKPGVAPVVLVRGEVLPGDARECRLTVEDNGIGFDEKYRDRIFQVFQRLHGRDEYEGTGVGLAICQKIVERHGGTIAAQGRPGEGAMFVITLPVRQPTTEAPDNAEHTQADYDPDGR